MFQNFLLLQGAFIYLRINMNIHQSIFLISFFFLSFIGRAQYHFEGYVNNADQNSSVYLSVIEDYRKISGVFPEQILSKTSIDSLGYFSFSGNNLPNTNRIYRIHVDNCKESEQDINHFSGHCVNSKEIVFIANNNSQYSFPFTFDNEMFCKVESTDKNAQVFLKIDSLKNDMRYAFGTYRSEANRKLNSEKWFKTFQDYGVELKEPLAELYIYSFLSNRSDNLYNYYLKDLKENTYYNDLLLRLQKNYPNAYYTQQYENELQADTFLVNNEEADSFKMSTFLLISLLIISVLLNFIVIKKNKNLKNQSNSKEKLTSQEQKTLELILADKTNKEIASELFISVSTVKTHINNLYKKLNVTSREEVKKLNL